MSGTSKILAVGTLFLNSSSQCETLLKVIASTTEKQTMKQSVLSYPKTRMCSKPSCPAVSHSCSTTSFN